MTFEMQHTGQVWDLTCQAHSEFTATVATLLPGKTIDEMALLFTGDAVLFDFITDLTHHRDVTLFNTAKDIVISDPVPGQYAVRYWFMSTGLPFRLELMRIIDGFSPLHHALIEHPAVSAGSRSVLGVHASLKCTDEEDYAATVHALRQGGYQVLQRCTSEYGKFSYWNHPDDALSWLLKPRLNQRDAS